jgi:GTP diphosphokinase / guanosine-3',5'-bis(diphosphate) 3'-diphosphatase
VIKARWTSQQEIAFLAGLRIVGTDRVGLINDVTKVISNELKVNMRSITVDSDSGSLKAPSNFMCIVPSIWKNLVATFQK